MEPVAIETALEAELPEEGALEKAEPVAAVLEAEPATLAVLEAVEFRGAVLALVLVWAAAREEEEEEVVGATLDPEVLREAAAVVMVGLDEAGTREEGAGAAAEGARLAADVAGLAPSTGREGRSRRRVYTSAPKLRRSMSHWAHP